MSITRPAIFHRSLIAAVGLFNRNPWSQLGLQFIDRADLEMYVEDGIWTRHAHAFVDDEAFVRAYDRGVRATGSDYEIRWRAHVMLWAAQSCLPLPGSFVECGTGRGFMASAICEAAGWGSRPFYLVDTFLPTSVGSEGVQPAHGRANPYYAADAASVRDNFAEWEGVRVVQGRIPECLDTVPVEEVAFLHVDLNNATAEDGAVRHFWPRLVEGAFLVYDDYGFPGAELQREAADCTGNDLGFSIAALPTGQGLVVKR